MAQSRNFYYIEFNAEDKKDIQFRQQRFRYKAKGLNTGIHELAIALNGSEAVAFPTWVVLDKNYEVLFRYNGVLHQAELQEVLKALNKIK